LKIKDVDDVGGFRGAFESFVDHSFAESFRHKWIEPGDTLILNAAHNSDYVGSKTYFATEAVSGVLPTGEWLVVRGIPEIASKRYIHHWLTSEKTRSQIRDRVRGIHLYPKDVAELPISLPPFKQQERIATILDKADAIRSKRRRALKLADEFLRSAFLDLFGDPVANPKGWPTSTVGELAPARGDIVDGPFGSSLKPEHYVESGVRVIRNANIQRGRFDATQFRYVTPEKFEEIKRSQVRLGDLLISTKGTVGNVCLMPALDGPSVLSATGTVRIRLKDSRISTDFMMWQMLMPQYQGYIQENLDGAIQKYLNLSGIRALRLILPQGQDRFLNLTRKVSVLRDRALRHALESDSLFNSLQQRAFSGQLTAT